MFLPNYRAMGRCRVLLLVLLATWFAIEKTRLGALSTRAPENQTSVGRVWREMFRSMVMLTYGWVSRCRIC